MYSRKGAPVLGDTSSCASPSTFGEQDVEWKTGCIYLGVFLVRAWVCLFCFGAFCFVFQIKQEVVLEFKDPQSAMSMIAPWCFYFRWL